MSSERFARLETLYHAARTRTPEARAAFLAEACGSDDELRRDVESLLQQEGHSFGSVASAVVDHRAALARGAAIGVYRIIEPIGAGGMGEVYRAHDTKLGRDVAIKVLPAIFTSDAERLARFEREARVLAALNHPNIATIYGLEGAGWQAALVMELVDGSTLAERLRTGAIPMAETLAIARQIADALAAAHEKGIIHRDLKPANVKITPGGLVKVLDFGLAKLEVEAGAGAALADAPTLSAGHTREDSRVGTPAYMSPEQARGKAVDTRTDIWAFGCVLYEMLRGRAAFAGETISDTIAAILERDPDWGALPATTPPGVRRVLRRCLEKDPSRRLHAIVDARLEIEDAVSGAEDANVEAGRRGEGRGRSAALVAALALTIVAATGLAFWRSALSHVSDGPLLSEVTRLTYDSGLTTDPALSADGRLLAYASDRASPSASEGNLDIWVQQISGGEPIRLTRDPADDYEPAFSPDGAAIAFRSDRNGGGIYVIPTLGGEARLVAAGGRRPRFSPDGQWIVYWTGEPYSSVRASASKVFAVRATGGSPIPIGSGLVAPIFPVWSPNGQRVLLRSGSWFSPETWWTVSPETGSTVETADPAFFESRGLSHPTPVAWIRDPDRIVFATAPDFAPVSALWVVAISPTTWKLVGTPHRLTTGTGLETVASVAAVQGGALRFVFSSRSISEGVWSLPIGTNHEPPGREPVRLTDGESGGQPSLSADGRLLFFNAFLSVNPRNWVKDLASHQKTVLTTTQYERKPAPTADGSRVAYQALDPATSKMAEYVVDVQSRVGEMPQPGVPRKISRLDSASCGWPWSWSSTGKHLLYNCPIPGPVLMYDRDTGASTQVLGEGITFVQFSPDDRWLAFQKTVDETSHVFVAPFARGRPPPEDEWISVTPDGGQNAQWTADGSTIYFLSLRDGFFCVWGQRLDPVNRKPTGAPFAVYHAHSSRRSLTNGFNQALTVTADRIAFVLAEQTGNIWMAKWEEQK